METGQNRVGPIGLKAPLVTNITVSRRVVLVVVGPAFGVRSDPYDVSYLASNRCGILRHKSHLEASVTDVLFAGSSI